MNILYYDCFSGISGDMHLAAMLDIGVKPDYLLSELSKLGLANYELQISKDKRNGIEGTKVTIQVNDDDKKHRTLSDIEQLVNASHLNANVKALSLKMFRLLADAEAKVHGTTPQKIHFHEVGAIDSIIDTVGSAICLDFLKVDKIICSAVELGGGFVKCEHGTMPVPAPATIELLKGVPVKTGAVPFETTTPTGAAILAANVDEFCNQLNFTPGKTAYGIGHRKLDIPNVLRISMGTQSSSAAQADKITEIECNIDDMNPEFYDDIIARLLDSGANDVTLTPIIMKKSRPAITLSVLCGQSNVDVISEILLRETTTLGIRKRELDRVTLVREITIVNTKYGEIHMKQALREGKVIKSKPEYEDCVSAARKNNVSLQQVYEEVSRCLHKSIE